MDKPVERQRKREPDRPSSTSINCVLLGAGNVLLHVELRDTQAASPTATLELRRDGPEETQIVKIHIEKHEVAVFAELFSKLWDVLHAVLREEQPAESVTTLPIAISRHHQ